MTALRPDEHKRAQQEHMVRQQLSPNFLNPAHAWRRLFAEAWGTFVLVGVDGQARAGDWGRDTNAVPEHFCLHRARNE